jgi:hypothetical protein
VNLDTHRTVARAAMAAAICAASILVNQSTRTWISGPDSAAAATAGSTTQFGVGIDVREGSFPTNRSSGRSAPAGSAPSSGQHRPAAPREETTGVGGVSHHCAGHFPCV